MTVRVCEKLWYGLLQREIISIVDCTKNTGVREDVYCLDSASNDVVVNKHYAPRGAWIGISYREFKKNMLPHNSTENLKIRFRKQPDCGEDRNVYI